jgi:hypothetical protein
LNDRRRQIGQFLVESRDNPFGNLVLVHNSIPLSFRNAAKACVAREQ